MSTHAAEPYYEHNHAHIADELDRLDLLLRLRVAAFRQSSQSRTEPRGHHLVIADDDVDWLLDSAYAPPADSSETLHIGQLLSDREREIGARVAESLRRGTFLGLPHVARLFSLSHFELQAVLICLAPELRRKYDRVFAYLQDDITRKRPSADLILDLLCDSEPDKWAARALLAPRAALLHTGILQTVDDPQSPSGSSGLAQFLRLDARILQFILGEQVLDARLTSLVQVQHPVAPADEPVVDPEAKAALHAFATRWSAAAPGARERVLVHLHGRRGSGKRDLALSVCGTLGCSLLVLDAQRLPAHPDDAEPLLRLAFRESLLLQTPLYITPAAVFLREGEQVTALRSALAQVVQSYGWLTFLAGDVPWPQQHLFDGVLFYHAAVPMPRTAVRRNAWEQALHAVQPDTAIAALAPALAERFALTPGQIRQAASTLAQQRLVHDSSAPVTFDEVAAICRTQSHHELAALAAKIETRHEWSDLILPEDKLAQLREICSQVRHQSLVYEQWGFGRKLARGRGISALFSGPPGTGKTMAAEVIAADLQLDLYKIDLARVVSKYIGETEKNLSRIFGEAEDSNAILFFDEADAIFGKRTEISDAHDRYANIETSYLLQRMEEYSGIVILASNLCENMDDAFLRRLRFVVEFPFPDAANRLAIWKAHLPPEAPRGALEYELLAGRIQLAGGNIKNIVVTAAFLAAANGGVIDMQHVVSGARREFEKIGKLWDDGLVQSGIARRHD